MVKVDQYAMVLEPGLSFNRGRLISPGIMHISIDLLNTTREFVMIFIGDDIEIQAEELVFTYARSGGPGGQNVNKVNSKAVLHWHVLKSTSLSEDIKDRFLERYSNRINADGKLVLSSQKYRDQRSNTEDCLERLKSMIEAVQHKPVKRKSTRVPRAVKKKRVENKRKNSLKKQMRNKPELD